MGKCKKSKSYQHLKFPSGPPPQYLIGLKPLNFGVRMGSGAFGLVWPIAIYTVDRMYLYLRAKCETTSQKALELENWHDMTL